MTYSLANRSFTGGIILLMDSWKIAKAVIERDVCQSTANNRYVQCHDYAQ